MRFWTGVLVLVIGLVLGAALAVMGPRLAGPYLPELTEERRKDLVRVVHKRMEEARVEIRNIRRDANDSVKKLLKDKLISEDEDKRAHEEIQKLTDSMIQKLDQAVKTKEKEVLELK